jgi:hypothetical protein
MIAAGTTIFVAAARCSDDLTPVHLIAGALRLVPRCPASGLANHAERRLLGAGYVPLDR